MRPTSPDPSDSASPASPAADLRQGPVPPPSPSTSPESEHVFSSPASLHAWRDRSGRARLRIPSWVIFKRDPAPEECRLHRYYARIMSAFGTKAKCLSHQETSALR